MTPTEIRAAFPSWVPVLMADGEYAKPTLRWLKGDFWTWFQRDRWNKGLTKWTRRNDCDNFARAYAQAAADCHAISSGNEAEGLAVGEIWFVSEKAGPHAIVVAFTDEGKVYIEPQTGERLTLTPTEEQSAFNVRF